MTRIHKLPVGAPRPATRGAPARSERTRAAIREAANRLFLERGVDATTVDAICAAADISKGTFYLYFHRKEDLLVEYGLQRLRLWRDMLPDGICFEGVGIIPDIEVRTTPKDFADRDPVLDTDVKQVSARN